MRRIDVFILVDEGRDIQLVPILDFIRANTSITLETLNFSNLKAFIELYVTEDLDFVCKGNHYVQLIRNFTDVSEFESSDINEITTTKSNMEKIFYQNIINSILFRLAIQVIKYYKNLLDNTSVDALRAATTINTLTSLTNTIPDSVYMEGHNDDVLHPKQQPIR